MNPTIRARLSVIVVLLMLVTASVAPAATLLVANKSEATVSFLDLESGEVVATLPTGDGPHEVAVSPDGKKALVTNYGRREPGSSLTLLDISGVKVLKTIDLGDYRRPHGIEWLDERYVAVTAEANKALIKVDVDEGKVVSAIATDQEISHMLAMGEGGRAFLANIGSGSMTVIDLEKGERVANIPTGDGAEGIAVLGKQVWVTNRGADTVTVLDAETLKEIKSFKSESFPIRARATPQGHILVTRAATGDMAIYDTKSLAEVKVVDFDLKAVGFEGRLFHDRFGDSSVPIGVAIDDDGSHAFVAHSNADVITEVDLEKGEISRLLTAGREPDGMAFTTETVSK